MLWRTVLCVLFVVGVCAKPRSGEDQQNECDKSNCTGDAYECVNGDCYCARGFIPNPFQNRCTKCPGAGEKCFGPCCSENTTLTCWQGVCQKCYDPYGTWICRESLDHILLISSTQIAMATALVLGIIATFMLLYKLCAASTLRPMGGGSNYEGRLSIGSLQLYVEERLRDAPPRYSRTAPPGTTAIPATVYVNSGFIHDCSVLPPPPYTPPKNEDTQHASVHI
uniref:EGF-like domain-containing protein n=1 Tax=Pectinophora gossypiella TaxID=13191 RepID=A0A1E1W8M8_PECGO